jgi:integrase/recombinase XerD
MRIQKDPIRLRQRLCKDGSKSLYLDIYMNGVRRYEYLKLYLIPEKNAKDKQKKCSCEHD